MILALALTLSLGAWAQGQLLTTINASSGFTNGTQTFDNIVTVTLDDVFYDANDGWYCSGSPRIVEVAPVNGVTVTSYMLYFSATDPIEYEGSSFIVALEGDRVLADDISTQLGSVGITKIEVYGTQGGGVRRTADNTWKFAMPGYNTALGIEYKDYPQLAWTLGGSAIDTTTPINLYRGFDANFFASLGLTTSQAFATSHPSGATAAQLSVPTEWSETSQLDIYLSASDLDGFQAITLEQAQSIPCPDQSGEVYLIYGFDGNTTKMVPFYNGNRMESLVQPFSPYDIHYLATNYGAKYYYTANPVRFGSTAPSVVTIDAEGHAQAVGTGEATLYAVFDGDDDYRRDSVWFTLNLQSPDTLTLASNDDNMGTVSALIGGGEETLLTTIMSNANTNFTSGSKTFDNIATVTLSGEVGNDGDNDGWYHTNGTTLTVTPVEGITITRVKFTCAEGSAYDETAPFEAVLGEGAPMYNNYMFVNGNSCGSYGVTQIEVYGYAGAAGSNSVVALNEAKDTLIALPGAQVQVVATAVDGNYLSAWSNNDEVTNLLSDTATITMDGNLNLTATFAQNPLLTLNANQGGSVTIDGYTPASSEYTLLTTITPDGNGDPTYTMANKATLNNGGSYNSYSGWYWSSGSTKYLTVNAASGVNITKVKFTTNSGDTWEDTQAPFRVKLSSTYVSREDGSDLNGDGVTRVDVYTTTTIPAVYPTGVAAGTTANTYRVLPGTQLSVTATPEETHYLATLSTNGSDYDANSNQPVSQTFEMGTAPVTLTANFHAKPTLTLAQNESEWGSVSVSGPVVWNNQVWGSWDYFTSFPQTIGDITINKNNFYCYYSSGKLLLSRSVDNNSFVTFTSAGDNFTRIEMTYTGGSNLQPASEWTCANGVAVWEGNAPSVSITNANDFYITQIKFFRGSGIAQLTDNTYRVDYGATVKVNAQATTLHHVQGWQDENGTEIAGATMSDYFIGEPQNLFPAKSTVTLSNITADRTARALFGLNYRHLTFSHNEGGHMEFVIDYDSVSFANIETTSVESGNISIQAGQADEDGMYLKADESSVTIAVAGGAVITQVDFHVTNGTNLVNTISTDAEGATISTTDNNEYGSIRGMSAAELTISSSTTFDLQIDQFTVHYGNALPNGVAVGPNDSTWYVMPDTTVIVRAIPEEGHYLRSWASTPDQTDSVDALTVSLTVTTDDTLTATFAPNPILTLAVSDVAMGTVYFTGYQGNTITRAGIIQAQSVKLPYKWYEASDIMEIKGGNGEVTKDATSHYLTVNSVFEGIITVVTSTGAFNVTCEPTLPNGVHYNIADNNYTVLPYTDLSFTATPNPDYYFVDWAKVTESDSLVFDGGVATTVVNIDGDMKVQANFLHNPYLLTLEADSVMGSIDTVPGQEYVKADTVAGRYIVMADSTVSVIATPNTGYHINGWSHVNTINDTVSVTMTMDSTLRVSFDTNTYNVSYTVQKDERPVIGTNEEMGTVSLTGRDMHFLNDTLVVEAKYGYTFAGWYDTNAVLVSDTNVFVFSPVSDTAFEARFTVNEYYISGLASDTLAGYVLGSDTIEYLDSLTLTAVANSGYHFMGWQDTIGHVLGIAETLDIEAVSDSVVYAVYDTNHYILVVKVDNASTGFGTVSGSDSAARHFAEYQISAVADSGYRFVMWTDSVETNPRTVTLTSDSVFTAVFDTLHYNLAVVVDTNCEHMGTVAGSDSAARHFLSYEISATPNPGFHFVMWDDSVTTLTRTVELTSDSTFTAIFDYNPSLTLEYREAYGDVKFVVDNQTEIFNDISTTSLSAGGITVVADAADATYGISVKSPSTMTIVASGDNVITQVAFHLTNGTNRAETITADHGRVNATNGDAYGTIVDINSDTLVISSTSTKDINIDQLTIKYAPELPAGVVYLAEDDSNVYRVERNTTVQVLAIPNDDSYLMTWAGDTASTDDLVATVNVADSNLTVEARFSGDPVVTLTAEGHGRVYFDGYAGYTVNRNEAIQVTNFNEFPYYWYEEGAISDITGGNGMVTKDAETEHYVYVHGPFNGTATVVTTGGSFTVTCVPTVPNGVRVLSLDTYVVEPGSEFTVKAEPDSAYYLASWNDTTALDSVRTVTVVSDTALVANFLHFPYKLTLTADSVMGTLAVADSQAFVTKNADGTYTVMADSTVVLVATPNAGYHLESWSNVSGTADTISVTMVSDSTVIAFFDTTFAELAWDTNAFTGYSMIDFNAWKPVLDNPHGVEVRYGVVNDTILKVNDSTGVIGDTITGSMGGHRVMKTGTYTIYAVHDLSQEYFYDSVTYTLTVEQGVSISLTQNLDTAGVAYFSTYDSVETLIAAYGAPTFAVIAHDTTVGLIAKADTGYHFVNWEALVLAGTIPPTPAFQEISTDTAYTYRVPEAMAISVRANFDTNHYVLVAQLMDNCDSCGTVTGTDSAARHFNEYTLTATATPCYHFVNWTDTLGNEVSTLDTLVVSPVSDSILVAHFALNVYTGDTTVDVCDQFTWHDSTYTVTPATAPTYIYKTANNCDSTVTLNLTIRHSSGSDTTAVVCDTMNWYEHQNITESCDTLKHTFAGANAVGCDSTLTLKLTVKKSTESLLDTTVCEQFTWNKVDYFRSTIAHFDTINAVGCDSIAYLNLTVHYNSESTETVVTCDSTYDWNEFHYTTSTLGIYHTTNQYGCDSTATLDLTLNHVFVGIDEQQACESFTWTAGNGQTYTESQLDSTVTYTFVGGAANGCDSTVTLLLTISNHLASTDSVTACDEYTWINGVTYTESTGALGAPTYVYQLSSGCDSTVTLALTVNHSVETEIYDTACTYFIWDGTYYTSTGSYTKDYATVEGCDSTVTLHLVVNYPTDTAISVNSCGSYTWNDVEYTASGAYSQKLTGSNGCDSTVTLALTVKQSVTTTVTATACDSYEWHGVTYYESGNYSDTTTGSNGCDSITTLQLTISTTGSSVETIVACDSLTWIDGVTYYESTGELGAPTYPVAGENCSTIVTLNLTINHSVETSFDTAACNYFIWNGSYYAASGDFTKTFEALNGCDSTVTMHLTVNQPVATSFYDTACVSYTWNDVPYTASGAYSQTFQNIHGCDSTVTLYLTVKQPTMATVEAEACVSYEWNGETYTVGGSYKDTTLGSNGCDSITTLRLTINNPVHMAETEVACESYTWNGTEYTVSGNYTYSHADGNNCTQVDTLHLTINNPVHTAETEVACENYTWNGTVYTESGDYTYSHADGNNCTQVDTLHLTINNPVHTAETEVACESFIWNGTEYTVSGNYTYSHADANGCTQVDTLHLTIGNSVATEETITNCDNYEWNGRMYTESGDYTYSTTTAAGCDSTVTLHLTINHSAETSFDTLCYGSFVWNGETFSESGTYVRTLTTVNGCDSVVTLNLIVLPEDFVMPYLYNLMDVMLTINHNEEGMENVNYVYYRWYRDDELVLEGPNYDSYSEGGSRLNGCYYVEVAVDENMEYWVRSNTVCINSVGIADVEDIEFSIAPNPVMHGSMVNISVEGADLQGAEIRVYDLQGRMVLLQKDNGIIEAPQASGMYMVRLTLNDGRTAVKRLIVK